VFTDPTVAGDWLILTDRLDAADTLTRWSQTEPALAGLGSVTDLARLLAHQAGTDPQRVDALLGALVRIGGRAGGDDPDAVLVLVHLLADGLRAAAARLADLDADVLGVLVGELAAQIRAWPLRRTRAFAANLLRDTQLACWRELRPHRTRTYRDGGDVLIDPLDEDAVRDWLDHPVPGPGDGDAPELGDVLAWAQRSGLASPTDLALLLALERQRGYGTAARHRVAAAFGITERTLRRRRDRTLAALRTAAPSYLAEDGPHAAVAMA
jgi:hypothetical protein